MTTEEKIRKMATEELSELLREAHKLSPPWCKKKCLNEEIFDTIECDDCRLEWLKQEVIE